MNRDVRRTICTVHMVRHTGYSTRTMSNLGVWSTDWSYGRDTVTHLVGSDRLQITIHPVADPWCRVPRTNTIWYWLKCIVDVAWRPCQWWLVPIGHLPHGPSCWWTTTFSVHLASQTTHLLSKKHQRTWINFSGVCLAYVICTCVAQML